MDVVVPVVCCLQLYILFFIHIHDLFDVLHFMIDVHCSRT